MDQEKYVDESWKESAASEKDLLSDSETSSKEENIIHVDDSIKQEPEEQIIEPPTQAQDAPSGTEEEPDPAEMAFLNYMTSLGFQIMIFLGEVPHPVTNEIEKSVEQAKFLIDTLVMLREKTKGNLTQRENDFLNASIYELQMKYVEITQKEASEVTPENPS